MFVLMKSRMSLKMGNVRSKTRDTVNKEIFKNLPVPTRNWDAYPFADLCATLSRSKTHTIVSISAAASLVSIGCMSMDRFGKLRWMCPNWRHISTNLVQRWRLVSSIVQPVSMNWVGKLHSVLLHRFAFSVIFHIVPFPRK